MSYYSGRNMRGRNSSGSSRRKNIKIDYLKVLRSIGHTPLVETHRIQKILGRPAKLNLKLEYENPTRSIMDRVAVKVIEECERSHPEKLKKGATLVTVGDPNFSASIGLICAAKGYKTVAAFVGPDTSAHKLRLMKTLGVKVCTVPTEDFKTSGLFYRSLAHNLSIFLPGAINLNAMVPQDIVESVAEEFAEELYQQLAGNFPHVLVGEKDIFGIFKTVAKILQKKMATRFNSNNNPTCRDCRMVQVEVTIPKFADYYRKEEHCSIVSQTTGIEKVYVDDSESYNMARRFIFEEGIFCGHKGGSLLAGALKSLRVRPLSLSSTELNTSSNNYCSDQLRVLLIINDHISLDNDIFLCDNWMLSKGHFTEADMSRMKWWNGITLSNLRLRQVPLLEASTSCRDALRTLDRHARAKKFPAAFGILMDSTTQGSESITGIVDRKLLSKSLKNKKVSPKASVGFPTRRNRMNNSNRNMSNSTIPPYDQLYTLKSFNRMPFDATLGELEEAFETHRLALIYKQSYKMESKNVVTAPRSNIGAGGRRRLNETHVPRGVASKVDMLEWIAGVMDHHRARSQWGINLRTMFD